MLPDYELTSNVYIRQNEAETQDGFFYYTPDGKQTKFIGVDRVEDKYSVFTNSDNHIFSMAFFRDPLTQSYSRSVFSFLNLTGNIGGLFEVLQIGGSLVVGMFAGQMFLFSIVSSLYQVEHQRRDLDRKSKLIPIEELKDDQQPDLSNLNLEEIKKSSNHEEHFYEDEKSDACLTMQTLQNESEKIKNTIVENATNSMEKRRKLTYSCLDMFYSIF